MKILLTGAAGFIGAATALRLLNDGHTVVGLDNINDYYDPALKIARLENAGIVMTVDAEEGTEAQSVLYANYRFVKGDLANEQLVGSLFAKEGFDAVINLAAQAGVRYSLENPRAYIKSNIDGFLNILEGCRHYPVKHLVYASSSSVYGMDTPVPYKETATASAPESLYAATKRSNELMASCYSKLYDIPATGLRFFTVYGPWGRPDMAPFIFMSKIFAGKEMRVFNNGDMSRDFTYIDDIVEGIVRILALPSVEKTPKHDVFNIGHSDPVQLMDFIRTIESKAGKKGVMKFEPMQKGDVLTTYADATKLRERTGYQPRVSLDEGIGKFAEWYLSELNPLREL